MVTEPLRAEPVLAVTDTVTFVLLVPLVGDKDTQAGPTFVILDHGQIKANADQGDGGAIFIITDNYLFWSNDNNLMMN